MKRDSAENVQREILEGLFDFKTLESGKTDAAALVDPRWVDEAQRVGGQDVIATAAAKERVVGRRSSRRERAAASQQKPGPARDIAVGLARRPGGSADDFMISVIYQDRSLGKDRILEEISDVAKGEVEIRYAGRVRALPSWHRSRVDPLQVGAGCGHPNVTVGTLGFFARDKTDGAIGIVSNNHVLADVNSAGIGDEIIQPGRKDGGRAPSDAFARLARFVEIRFDGVPNTLDCAFARLDMENARGTILNEVLDGAQNGAGRIASCTPVDLVPGDLVTKNGRTTNFTQGQVMAINVLNLNVDLGNGLVARFDGQVRIETVNDNRFSAGGDSGSLILRNDGAPGALLFAGSGSGGTLNKGMTFANPLGQVLSALDVEMII